VVVVGVVVVGVVVVVTAVVCPMQLVEKPVGINADEVRDMIAACRANNVQLMDGG
jgi:hypothetical protein